MMPKTVTIFGTAKANRSDAVWQLAYDIGKACAQAGFTIANGGYGGTMLAAAQGAFDCGGHTIGVTCTAFGRKGPNEFIRQEVVTSTLSERLSKLIELGDAYVVLQGGTGTLLEFAQVLELRNKGFLPPEKPIIISWDGWQSLLQMLAFQDPTCKEFVTYAATAEQIVRRLKNQGL